MSQQIEVNDIITAAGETAGVNHGGAPNGGAPGEGQAKIITQFCNRREYRCKIAQTICGNRKFLLFHAKNNGIC